MLTSDDWTMIKFWLEIYGREPSRFEQRESNPDKVWKIAEDDWRNREKWDPYSVTVKEMLLRTNPTFAPWTIVEVNNRPYARLNVLSA